MSDTGTTTYDLIRVVNVGDEPLVLNGNQRYEIPVGGERILPFTVAASWFGDPRLRNDGKDKLRDLAWRQIQFLWGYTEGMVYLKDRWDPSKGTKTWDDFRPKVECFDMDGNRVHMILDDPEGLHVGDFRGPALQDPAYLNAVELSNQVADLQRQLAQLTNALQNISPAHVTQTAISPEVDRSGPQHIPPATDGPPIPPSFLPDDDDTQAPTGDAPVFDAVTLPPPSEEPVGDDSPRTAKTRRR